MSHNNLPFRLPQSGDVPGRKYLEAAYDYLDAESGASPVADGRWLLLRGGDSLYCLGR